MGREASPIYQIYHYCVVSNARYGFLITSKELLVIRIKPVVESPGHGTSTDGRTARSLGKVSEAVAAQSGERSTALQHELRYNGLVEYKAIPWTSHWSRAGEEVDSFRDLTINLSLWILCILAGNNCSPDWDYIPLVDEPLRPKEVGQGNVFTERMAQGEAYNEDETDVAPSQSTLSSFVFSNPSMSFSAPPFPPLSDRTQVCKPVTRPSRIHC